MDLYGKRLRFILLVSGAAIVMLILSWRFIQGGASSVQQGFVPVNEQMQELLNRQSEDAGARADNSPKSAEGAVSSKDSKNPMNVQGARNAKDATDAMDVKVSKDPKDPKDTRDAKESMDTKDLKESQSGGEKAVESVSSGSISSASDVSKVNINTATMEQLDKLPGIGESKAKAILAYRGEKGYFRKIEDLVNVKGIGDKMLDKLKPYIYATSP